MFAPKYTAKILKSVPRTVYWKKFYVTKTTSKIEPTSQITHFDTPSPPSIFWRWLAENGHFSQNSSCWPPAWRANVRTLVLYPCGRTFDP